MNKETFIDEVKKLGITLTNDTLDKLDRYYKMIVDFNSHTNLTRITDESEVYLKHFYDSLTLYKAICLDNQTLLDVGTGAGFPGLVLKIVFPNLKVTLLDSLNKRIMFLNNVIKELDLKDVTTVHARAEEYIKESREKFDIVTSRAVANLNILSELCIPYVKLNGYFIAMKSNAEEELKASVSAIKTLGSVLKNVLSFRLPIENSKRTIVLIEKLSITSPKYPRKFNEIKKKPL